MDLFVNVAIEVIQMNDEYRAFKESRESNHPDIPHWEPAKNAEETQDSSDFLAHHGVKGMHWGIRKDRQNKTSSSGNKKDPKREKDVPSDPNFRSKTLSYKVKPQRLTDQELKERNERMQNELKYNQLRKQLQPKTKAERRKELRDKIFVATASTAAASIMTSIYSNAAKAFIKRASGGKVKL